MIRPGSLRIAKLRLYDELQAIQPEGLTVSDMDIMFYLTRDHEVLQLLRDREAEADLRKSAPSADLTKISEVQKPYQERVSSLRREGWSDTPAVVLTNEKKSEVAVVALDGTYWLGSRVASAPGKST